MNGSPAIPRMALLAALLPGQALLAGTLGPVTGLHARDDANSVIAAGTWTADTGPLYQWNAPTPAGFPIAGYSYDFNTVPDCTIDGVDTQFQASALANGVQEFQVRAIDDGANCGPVSTLSFGIDDQPDTVTALAAFTQSGGTPIGDGDWTMDPTPFVSWNAAVSTAPLVGYSIGLDVVPNCLADILQTEIQFSAQSNGAHTFRVRPIDAAGNCGIVSAYQLNIDTAADAITGLSAQDGGGMAIADGAWTNETTPTMNWDASISASPIEGYSHATNTSPDCVVDQTGTSVQIGPLGEGPGSFEVRAIDTAGNCGLTSTFSLAVDTAADAVTGLVARDGDDQLLPESTYSSEADPVFAWDASGGTSPTAGYSVALDAVPDCVVDLTDTSIPFMGLADGQHEFGVRAIDEAGNCGSPSTFSYWLDVDTTPVNVFVAVTAVDEPWINGGPAGVLIEFGNFGPADALTTSVSDDFDGVLEACDWTCQPSGAAACGSPAGSGPIDQIVAIPVGDQVAFMLTCVVVAGDPGPVGAEAVTADWEPDQQPANNSASIVVTASLFADSFE